MSDILRQFILCFAMSASVGIGIGNALQSFQWGMAIFSCGNFLIMLMMFGYYIARELIDHLFRKVRGL